MGEKTRLFRVRPGWDHYLGPEFLRAQGYLWQEVSGLTSSSHYAVSSFVTGHKTYIDKDALEEITDDNEG